MENIKVDISKVYNFIPASEIQNLSEKTWKAAEELEQKTGKGNDFLGWVNLPSSISEQHLKDFEQTASRMQQEIDSGSYQKWTVIRQ